MNTDARNHHYANADALGRAVALRLSEGIESLPHEVSERLKAARAQAVAKRKIVSVQQIATAVVASGGEAALQFGDHDGGWLNRIASFLPLFALVVGLIFIAVMQDEVRIREIAEVDAELLTDELPPAAYTDPGFTQYLRTNQVR